MTMKPRPGNRPRYLGHCTRAERLAITMLKRFTEECDGQDLVEYALLTALVVAGAVVALGPFQAVISDVWTTISANLAGNS